MGKKRKIGPAIGFLGEFVWFGYIVFFNHWGLLPAVSLFAYIHFMNWKKWSSE